MPEFEVVYEGRVRETYIVEADSAEEAWSRWVYDGELIGSEIYDGEAVSVEEID